MQKRFLDFLSEWQFFKDFDEWAEDKSVIPRVILLGIMLILGYQIVFSKSCWSLLAPINLGIHEAGHLLTGFLGNFLCALSGSVFQLLAPIVAAFMLMRIPDYFGIPFCGVWLASNFYGVAIYVGDARKLELTLVSVGGGDAYHDWEYILGELGMLRYDTFIAGILYFLGFAVLIASLLLCSYMIYRMMQRPVAVSSQRR